MQGTQNQTATASELIRVEAEIAAGGDPFGDHDDDAGGTAGDAGQAAEAAAAAAAQQQPPAGAAGNDGAAAVADAGAGAGAGAGDAAAQAAGQGSGQDAGGMTLEDIQATLKAITPQQAAELNIKVPDVSGLAQKLNELDALRATIEERWASGDLDDKQRAAELLKVSRDERTINSQLAKAETLAEIVAQQQQRDQQAAIDSIVALGAEQGVDYAKDPVAAQEFDGFVNALANMPAHASTPAGELYMRAHHAVLAARGIAPGRQAAQQSAAGAAAGAAPARQAPAIPPSVRGLPTAAAQTTGGGLNEVLGKLSGPEYQAAFDKLTPAQQAALLDE